MISQIIGTFMVVGPNFAPGCQVISSHRTFSKPWTGDGASPKTLQCTPGAISSPFASVDAVLGVALSNTAEAPVRPTVIAVRRSISITHASLSMYQRTIAAALDLLEQASVVSGVGITTINAV